MALARRRLSFSISVTSPGLCFLAAAIVGTGQSDGDGSADSPASASDDCNFAGGAVRHGGMFGLATQLTPN